MKSFRISFLRTFDFSNFLELFLKIAFKVEDGAAVLI